jgi:hypothetical protein
MKPLKILLLTGLIFFVALYISVLITMKPGETRRWRRGGFELWVGRYPTWRMGLFEKLVVLVCVGITALLIVHLWGTHSEDALAKKIIWSIVLLIPLIGWVLYANCYFKAHVK